MSVAATTHPATGGLRRGRGRIRFVLAAVGALLCVAGVVLVHAAPARAAALPRTTVSLTFDDGLSDQTSAVSSLKKYGMKGTFYINSANIGASGFLTRSDLTTLAADGNEIGGHTVTHPDLTTLSPTEANRQICLDRQTLTSWGFTVTSFAYPFANYNSADQQIVRDCGYNSARASGDLWAPYGCLDCPGAQPVPPTDPYAIKTADDVEQNWTLSNLEQTVTHAERTGGWLVLMFHHVCAGCNVNSVSPTIFDRFLQWLSLRSLLGTGVRTVDQVIGGTAKPVVPPAAAPAPPGTSDNGIVNPSLEKAGSGGLPDCWSATGYGTNTRTFDQVTDAHTGTYGETITMTSRTDGDAKLVPTFDLGTCSPSVTVGKHYLVSAWYKATTQTYFTLYQRNAIGQWAYWTQSPRLAAADQWTLATWITPAVPSGMVATSLGLTIDGVGTLTTDDYSLSEAPDSNPPAPPGVNALKNPSLEQAGGDGFPQCWTGAGYGTNTVAWSRVTDASDGTYAERLDITSLTDGDAKLIPTFDSANCAPAVTPGHPYTFAVSYKSTAATFFTIYTQDSSGTWSYWTQSPNFDASSTYTRATWTSPPIPAGVTAVSFGLTLPSVGSVTTDDYSLVDSSS